MENIDNEIQQVVASTKILRLPKQKLATFGVTDIHYYVLTVPAYLSAEENNKETAIREGRVIAERPRIITPYYLLHTEGFSQSARRYLNILVEKYGPYVPGLFYSYRNELKDLSIVAKDLDEVTRDIDEAATKSGDPLVAIIQGEDELWDVSLLKLIIEIMRQSFPANSNDFISQGLMNIDSSGLPLDARLKLEELFVMVKQGEVEPRELKEELDRWGVFAEYEDRFLAIFG